MQRELISTGRRRPRTSAPFPPHRRGHILLMSLLVVAVQAPLGRALVTVAGGSGSQKTVPVPLPFLPSAFKLPGGGLRVHMAPSRLDADALRTSTPALGLLRSRVALELGLPFLITAGHWYDM